MDEFHTGGHAATRELAGHLELRAGLRVLDVGSGLGGPARHLAQHAGADVTGVDLTEEYVDVARWLTDRVGLTGQARFQQGDVTTLPFPRASFDRAWMLHVGMNIEDKARLFTEISRVLTDEGLFIVYDVMLLGDPALVRSAGAAIRADCRAWFAQAEEHVRRRRGDVLIEAAPGSVQEFLDSALPYAADGYPVELVVLAVREADSRLATALRYARALQIGGTGRFTSRSGHDTCFNALADIVAAAERHPQIAAITVIRKDGQALLRHESTSPGQASWALAAERLRPYTEQEAIAFLRLHQALRRALPRHRAELDEIAALARPLMPPGVQPARIDRPHPPVWPLPIPRDAAVNGRGGIGYGIGDNGVLITYNGVLLDTDVLYEAARRVHTAIRSVLDPIAAQDPHGHEPAIDLLAVH